MTGSWQVLAPPYDGRSTRRRPSFSVVIAAYQAESTVADAIGSVLAQTTPPSEIVVCDDGSTDRTAEVVRTFGSAVRLVQRSNGGESAAKNTAVRAAHGDFVVVLDADDVFAPSRLEALAWLAEKRPDLDVLVTDAHRVVDGERVGRAYHPGWRFECADQPAEILRRNFVLGLAAVRRERWLAVGGFDEAVRLTADWDFFIRLIRSGSRVGLVDAPLAEYRLRPGTLSSDRLRLVESRIATLERARERGGLREHERAGLDAALAAQRRTLLVGRARAALTDDGGSVRRDLLAIVLDPGFRPSRRAAALATACFPAAAAAWLRLRDRRTVDLGTGLRARRPAGTQR